MGCFVQLLLLLFCCLPNEASDSLLVFALYIGNPQLTNGKVLIADDEIGSICAARLCLVYVPAWAVNHVCNTVSQWNSSGACGRRK